MTCDFHTLKVLIRRLTRETYCIRVIIVYHFIIKVIIVSNSENPVYRAIVRLVAKCQTDSFGCTFIPVEIRYLLDGGVWWKMLDILVCDDVHVENLMVQVDGCYDGIFLFFFFFFLAITCVFRLMPSHLAGCQRSVCSRTRSKGSGRG